MTLSVPSHRVAGVGLGWGKGRSSTPSARRRRSSATREDTSEAATGAASLSNSSIARSIGASHGLGPRSTSPRSLPERSNQLHHNSSSERVRAT
jgi:hypothetical protein